MFVNKTDIWRVRYHFSPWASCQIRKIAGAHAPGMPGTFSPSPQVSDPDMYHATCVTHVPWCLPGSLTSGSFENGGGKNVPGIPGACTIHNFTYLVRDPLRRHVKPTSHCHDFLQRTTMKYHDLATKNFYTNGYGDCRLGRLTFFKEKNRDVSARLTHTILDERQSCSGEPNGEPTSRCSTKHNEL